METLCRMHVQEGTVFQLVCPDTKCNASIPPYVLKRLLTGEEFERWDRLVLKKALDSMSDVVYCPRCGIGCLEDESNNAQCPKCSFIFCSLCKEPCHPGKHCITPEDMIKRQQVKFKICTKITFIFVFCSWFSSLHSNQCIKHLESPYYVIQWYNVHLTCTLIKIWGSEKLLLRTRY